MNYEKRDSLGMYRPFKDDQSGPGPRLMGADTLIGNSVYNHQDESLGDIKEIMLDMRSGQISYAVLEFGGFLGMGTKLFAVPWQALTLDTIEKRFVLKINKERLDDAPGFEKDNWPDMADPIWAKSIHDYYGTRAHDDPFDQDLTDTTGAIDNDLTTPRSIDGDLVDPNRTTDSDVGDLPADPSRPKDYKGPSGI